MDVGTHVPKYSEYSRLFETGRLVTNVRCTYNGRRGGADIAWMSEEKRKTYTGSLHSVPTFLDLFLLHMDPKAFGVISTRTVNNSLE